MTTNIVHPAELERMLQARLDEARATRQSASTPARTRPRRSRRGPLALIAGTLLAMSAAAVWASHSGSPFIDLTTNLSQVQHNGAVLTQGGVGAGTGNFDPFLTLQPGGSVPTEAGFNVCTEPVFGFSNAAIACPAPTIENTGGDRTHELRASSVPVTDFNGTKYREFFLDSNDAGSDPWMSIQVIRIFLDEQPDLNYNPTTNTFTGNAGPAPSLLWDLDGDGDQTILMNTQGLENGSGVSDISILIPDSLFPADCFYGSTTCNQFIYFGTIAGDPTLNVPGHTGKNWNTTAGFEEWSTELLPVVNVDKTVDISLDRTYPWDVTKEADGEPDHIDLNAGETATINWTVNVTVGTPTDSNAAITGDIVITNPTGGAIPAIPAVVEGVEDVLTLGGASSDADVTCPSAFPFTIAAGTSVTCTYSFDPTTTEDGTNEATVTLTLFDKNTPVGSTEYSDTADVTLADADITEIDECVTVTDDNMTPGDTSDDEQLDAELCVGEAPGSYPDSNTVGPFTGDDCTTGSVTNTAHIVTNDTATTDSDSDTVTWTCFEPTVTKTATGTFDRTWTWTIEKSGSETEVTLNANETATVSYDVTLSATSADSGFEVTGTITVGNPNPTNPMTVDVTDALDTGDSLAATAIDCGAAGDGDDVMVPAGGSVECTYSFALLDDSATLNTATATLNGVGYDGTDAVEWALEEETDECVDVSDTLQGVLDPVCAEDAPVTIEYDREVGPYPECGDFTVMNVASFETNDTGTTGDDSWTVIVHVVNCGEGCTPGFWQGGFGAQLWNVLNDPDWVANGGDGTNPFAHATLFNDFFADHTSLAGKTMLDIVGTGGGNAWPRKAARDVVAAYLNASFGLSYPFTPDDIVDMWAGAVTGGTTADFQAVHAQLGPANELGCTITQSTAESGPSAGWMLPLVGIAGLMGSVARRVRRR